MIAFIRPWSNNIHAFKHLTLIIFQLLSSKLKLENSSCLTSIEFFHHVNTKVQLWLRNACAPHLCRWRVPPRTKNLRHKLDTTQNTTLFITARYFVQLTSLFFAAAHLELTCGSYFLVARNPLTNPQFLKWSTLIWKCDDDDRCRKSVASDGPDQNVPWILD